MSRKLEKADIERTTPDSFSEATVRNEDITMVEDTEQHDDVTTTVEALPTNFSEEAALSNFIAAKTVR